MINETFYMSEISHKVTQVGVKYYPISLFFIASIISCLRGGAKVYEHPVGAWNFQIFFNHGENEYHQNQSFKAHLGAWNFKIFFNHGENQYLQN